MGTRYAITSHLPDPNPIEGASGQVVVPESVPVPVPQPPQAGILPSSGEFALSGHQRQEALHGARPRPQQLWQSTG